MKHFIYLIIVTLLFIRCTEKLDQSPSDSLPAEEAITTVTDLEYAVNGILYQFIYVPTITTINYYAGNFGLYADGKGGDVKYMKSYNHFSPIIRYQHDENSDYADGFYNVIYIAIARTNSVMSVVDNVKVESGEETAFNDLKGQLYALRGLLHFDAARLFCQLPAVVTDKDAANTGVVIADQVYPVNQKFVRSTLNQTYNFIVDQFVTSLDLLSKSKNYGKINYWASAALLSRVYLYLQDYNNALKYAHEVINNNAGYTLYSRNNYIDVWEQTATSESLFEVETSDKTSAQRNSLGYYTHPDGYAECAATETFASWLQADTNDIRREMVSYFCTTDSTLLAWWPIKYHGQPDAISPLYVNNPKVIRLSEVYLIASEAKLLGGSASGDHSPEWYYNELRNNRIANYVDAGSVTIDDILDERRRELFCENHRMFDLVRHKRSITHPFFTSAIAYNDYRIVVAIPKRERDISPGIIQNPSY